MRHDIIIFLLLLSTVSCQEEKTNYDASGSFEATETIISAEATGKILEFNIQEGEQLDSGQLVGFIDTTSLQLTRLQLAQNKKAILSGKPEARIQVEALRTELANAKRDRERTEKLVQGGVAAQQQLDHVNARIATLQAKIDAQESTLRTATTSINEQGNSVDVQMKEINEQLTKSRVVNPVRGTVLTKYAEKYEMAVIGKPLYKIADISTIILRAYITGDQLHQVKVGQHVKVITDNGSGGYKETEGIVSWINHKSEFTPKTIQTKNERANLVYAMKVTVKNDGYLKIGMYGEVTWNKQ
jgi:HlyD family secretion protein